MAHPDPDDLVGYALGALDPGEEPAIAAHAAACERCQLELRRLQPALGVLAESVEQLEAPETLRQSLMATVRAEAGREEAARTAPTRGPRGRQWLRIRGLSFGPATALAAVLIVVAAIAGYGVRDAGEESTETIAGQAPAGASASLELRDDSATLTTRRMPPLPEGAIYQVWLRRDGRVEPSSVFVPGSGGSAQASVPGAEDADEILVTRESEPGHTVPTSAPIVTVSLN